MQNKKTDPASVAHNAERQNKFVKALALELTSHVNAIMGQPEYRYLGDDYRVEIKRDREYAVLHLSNRVLMDLSSHDLSIVNRMISHYGFGPLAPLQRETPLHGSVTYWDALVKILCKDTDWFCAVAAATT